MKFWKIYDILGNMVGTFSSLVWLRNATGSLGFEEICCTRNEGLLDFQGEFKGKRIEGMHNLAIAIMDDAWILY